MYTILRVFTATTFPQPFKSKTESRKIARAMWKSKCKILEVVLLWTEGYS